MSADTIEQGFESQFHALTGNKPFPWQVALYRGLITGDIPVRCDIPTALGKTSVISCWLLGRAKRLSKHGEF